MDLGDGRYAYLALQHRIRVVEHRVHRVGGLAVVASQERLTYPMYSHHGEIDLCRYSFL